MALKKSQLYSSLWSSCDELRGGMDASQYKDYDGWTIHRKRAWTTLLSGGHYDYIDFSIINYCEKGTPASRRHIRTWMKHLSEFIHSLDLVRARPLPGMATALPAHAMEAVFGVPGEDIAQGRSHLA